MAMYSILIERFPARSGAASRARPAALAFRMKGMKLSRAAALAGIAGPVLFTAGWLASSLRQAAPMTEVQLSGLAAEHARDPQLMMAAFIVLGGCSIGLGAGLRRVCPRSAGPWLVMLAGGAGMLAVWLLRYRGASAGPLATAHLAANEAKPSTSDSSTNSPRTGTAAPSSSSSGAKCRSTAS